MNNKSLLKGTLIYSISDLLIKAGSMIMLPVFANLLTPKEYGIVGLLTPISSFIPLFMSLGFYMSQNKDLAILSKKEQKDSYILTVNFTLLLINIIFLIILCLPFSELVFSKIFDDLQFYPYVFITLITGFLGVFVTLADSYYQIIQSFKKKALGGVISFILNLGSSVILITIFDMGALGKLIGSLIANIFLLIYFYPGYLKRIKGVLFSIKYFKNGLIIGIPGMINVLIVYLNNYSDRFILNRYLTLDDIGIYTIAYTGGFILHSIINSIVSAWRPLYYNLEKNYVSVSNRNKELEKVLLNSIISITFICVFLQLFQKEAVVWILPDTYLPVINILPLLLFSTIFNFYYLFFIEINIYNGVYKFIPLVTISGLIVHVIFNLVFIEEYGLMAAAVSTIVANVFMAVGAMFNLKLRGFKNYSFNFKRHILILLFCFNPIILYLGVEIKVSLFGIILKIVYILSFFLVFQKEIKLLQYLQSLKRVKLKKY